MSLNHEEFDVTAKTDGDKPVYVTVQVNEIPRDPALAGIGCLLFLVAFLCLLYSLL